MCVKGDLLTFIESFLFERQERVVLNGHKDKGLKVKAGVPQGSILGPLFFLIYINDLSGNQKSHAKLFAADTSVYSVQYFAKAN